MGTIDRVARVLVAVAIGIAYFTHIISGTLAIVLFVFASIFIATSIISFCPLYFPFGISTRKKQPKTNDLI